MIINVRSTDTDGTEIIGGGVSVEQSVQLSIVYGVSVAVSSLAGVLVSLPVVLHVFVVASGVEDVSHIEEVSVLSAVALSLELPELPDVGNTTTLATEPDGTVTTQNVAPPCI